MKKIKLSVLLIYAVILGFSACGGGGGGGSDDPQNPGGDKTISISVINGVTPPAYGETPVSVITANAQFTGTVSWSTSPTKFEANTVYTATIELTAKDGYTLDGVSDDFFEVSGASVVSNDSDSGIITAEFPATGSAPPAVVNIKAILGVDAPARDAIPVTTITETEQYTGTISWSGSPTKFAASTVYTATITLTAKSGYTFNGISANYFTLSGATTVANSSNSGVITAVFPKTEDAAATLSEVTVGSATTITFETGTEFKIIVTPDISMTKKFPKGVDDSGSANVPARFIMGETEVTYELWYMIYCWATIDVGGGKRVDGGVLYSFAEVGREGNDGLDGAAPTMAKQEPVTHINWRDMIVWCNALTEYYNYNNGSAADLDCVYYTDASYSTPLRTSTDSRSIRYSTAGSQDMPYIYASATGNTDMANCIAKGFRLPGSNEWEYAARYIGTSMPSHTNYVLKDGVYYSKGNSASGATADCNDSSATIAVARCHESKTGAVKSKGIAGSNALGLYDMSGNVWEWCFDWSSGYAGYGYAGRVFRGGSFDDWVNDMPVGGVYSDIPYLLDMCIGFRFCRNM